MLRTPDPQVNEKWCFRNSRGSGTFTVVNVAGGRVKLRAAYDGKTKTISVRTLRGDYQPSHWPL